MCLQFIKINQIKTLIGRKKEKENKYWIKNIFLSKH